MDESSDDEADMFFIDWMLSSTLRNAAVEYFIQSEQKSRSANVHRDYEDGYRRFYEDYLDPESIYSDKHFRRRYRMPVSMFLQLVAKITAHDSYFKQKKDATGKPGIHPTLKIAAALKILCRGQTGDDAEEYLRLSESTAIESLKRFCSAVVELFEVEFLRLPNEEVVKSLMLENSKRGFPGMIASLDCMHMKWKNCPKAWQGQFQGKEGKCTMILEAAASYNLRFWHVFFGLPGSLNDINVIDRSPLAASIFGDQIPNVDYSINGNTRKAGYWLVDGIYPPWSVFVTTIHKPQGEKFQHFAKAQEAVRKDVERAFGVLQSRFRFLALGKGCEYWHLEEIKTMVKTCIILHNMLAETGQVNLDLPTELPVINAASGYIGSFSDYMCNVNAVTSKDAHLELRNDLIDHLWNLKGQQ